MKKTMDDIVKKGEKIYERKNVKAGSSSQG